MAKVQAPLFSLHAHGKLAQKLVYRRHAGGNRAVDYSVPTGPLTAAQTAQRQAYSDVAAAWSAAPHPARDVSAWRRRAALFSRIWSGYNAFLHDALPVTGAGDLWQMLSDGRYIGAGPNYIQIAMYDAALPPTPVCHWGLAPDSFPFSGPLTWHAAGYWWRNCAGMPSKTLVYWWVDFTGPGPTYGRTGIYADRTT